MPPLASVATKQSTGPSTQIKATASHDKSAQRRGSKRIHQNSILLTALDKTRLSAILRTESLVEYQFDILTRGFLPRGY